MYIINKNKKNRYRTAADWVAIRAGLDPLAPLPASFFEEEGEGTTTYVHIYIFMCVYMYMYHHPLAPLFFEEKQAGGGTTTA